MDANQLRRQSSALFDDFVDVDDFEQYKVTNIEDLPAPEERNVRGTQRVEAHKSVLNGKGA